MPADAEKRLGDELTDVVLRGVRELIARRHERYRQGLERSCRAWHRRPPLSAFGSFTDTAVLDKLPVMPEDRL